MPEIITLGEIGSGGGGGGPVTSTSITDATSVGRSVLTGDAAAGRTALGVNWANLTGKPTVIGAGADAAAARSAIGAGTSNLAIGTTSTTAKAGDWAPSAATISDAGAAGIEVVKGATKAAVRSYLEVPATADLTTKANLASPALTGTPTAPTAAAGTNTTQVATTAFVLANGGSPTLANLPAGTVVRRYYSGSAWPARGTARTDLSVEWVDLSGDAPDTNPAGFVDGLDTYWQVGEV